MCNELTQTPSDDYTICNGEVTIYTEGYEDLHIIMCILSHLERIPTVNVSLYTDPTQADYSTPDEYTVLQGQMFGLVCETESYFSANWQTIHDEPSEL